MNAHERKVEKSIRDVLYRRPIEVNTSLTFTGFNERAYGLHLFYVRVNAKPEENGFYRTCAAQVYTILRIVALLERRGVEFNESTSLREDADTFLKNNWNKLYAAFEGELFCNITIEDVRGKILKASSPAVKHKDVPSVVVGFAKEVIRDYSLEDLSF